MSSEPMPAEAQVAQVKGEAEAAILNGHSQTDDVAISVRNVGKRYMLYDKPQDRLKQSLFWRFGGNFGRPFWALRDVSFDVKRGESVGIIGRNGSGKSTLLQVIAGTLQPTTGSVEVKGRVAALLELGSGFNPEYTGRENVYLNGAILGISREEMSERFEEIAAFADIGEFIDQPVKLYSSGMFARLAFAVAIAVEPDILIVDEILAVGDYAFQQKCLAHLRRLRDAGLTLLYVSHSPDGVKSVCRHGLLLVNGQPVYWGTAEQAVNLYFDFIRQETNREAMQTQADIARPVPLGNSVSSHLRYGTGHVQMTRIEICSDRLERQTAFQFGEWINLVVSFVAYIDLEGLSISFLVRDMTGIDLLGTTTFDEQIRLPALPKGGRGSVRFRFQNLLRPGNFGVCVALNRVSRRDYTDNVLFDQIDVGATFLSLPDLERPIHYKFHLPIEISWLAD